jgi:hypothetical protein
MALQSFCEFDRKRPKRRRALQQQVWLEPAIAMMPGLETEMPEASRHQIDQAFCGHELR